MTRKISLTGLFALLLVSLFVCPSAQAQKKAKVPDKAFERLQQGLTYVNQKQYENALKEFTRAIEIHPQYATAYANRGLVYMQQKKYNKALDDLNKAVKLDPDNKMIHYNLTAYYSQQKQLDRALDSLDMALKLGFDDYDTLRKDPDLENLRQHPEFRKVLEKHKVFLK